MLQQEVSNYYRECTRHLRLLLLLNHAKRYRDVIRSVGCISSSVEVSVMEMERRDTVIQFKYLQTTIKSWKDERRKDKVICDKQGNGVQ